MSGPYQDNHTPQVIQDWLREKLLEDLVGCEVRFKYQDMRLMLNQIDADLANDAQ